MDSFVAAWSRRIAGTSYVTMTPVEVLTFLTGLAGRLAAAVRAELFSPAAGYLVGQELIDAHFTDLDSLAASVAVIGEDLLTGMGLPASAEAQSRVAALQAAVAAGFSGALRDRALSEQQAMLQAAMVARSDAERQLRTSEIQFRTVFSESALGILIGDLSGGILDANRALRDMLGQSVDELRRQRMGDLGHPDDPPNIWRAYEEVLSGEREHLRVDKPMVHANGSELWTQLTVSLLRDDHGHPHRVVAMFADVTERHLLETRLRHLATHDPLTQLPNRALFMERLEGVFHKPAVGARVGLCFLDLDSFKVVNDTFGHGTGDLLLMEIAGRLDKCISGQGHLVARLGGDEFVILVTDSTGADQVIDLAERIRDELAAPLFIHDHELSITASIGIVERLVAGTNPGDLLRAADITLYWAKAEGKARWALFDPIRNAREVARYTLATAMPAALARGEFVAVYQPVFRLSDGALLGTGATVQWHHPRAGVLGPEQVLGPADETGLGLRLGRWLLLTVCHEIRRWREQFPTMDIFVNVPLSSRQYRDPGLFDDVLQALGTAGVEPGRLQLELTRSMLDGACDEPLAALAALADKGVRLALGDFGPGHANLALLRGLPVHMMKIDKGFTLTLATPSPDPLDVRIVAALISFAHELGLTVTADGITGPGQVSRLLALGCDTGQGPFLAPAAPPEQMNRLFR